MDRRSTVRLQRYVLNPPMKAAVWLGLVPGHMIVETTGRVTGRRRRTVVGCHAHARLVQRAGTSLLSIRFDLS